MNDSVHLFSDEHLASCKMLSLTSAILGIEMLVHGDGISEHPLNRRKTSIM